MQAFSSPGPRHAALRAMIVQKGKKYPILEPSKFSQKFKLIINDHFNENLGMVKYDG